jgi:hypothetical protein
MSASPSQLQQLAELSVTVRFPQGANVPGQQHHFVTIDIDEDDPRWVQLQPMFAEWEVSDFVTTEFCDREVVAARWLELLPDWHHGYPQPRQGSFGYRRATYDLRDACEHCGAGMSQVAPFQMKGEPKWGRRGILQLNWVFDEFFVTPEVWGCVFEPQGIACRPVIDTKGAELQTVVQLVAKEEVSVSVESLMPEVCRSCRRTKYKPHTRGFFPALASQPMGAMVKTSQWFGSGASASRCVLVSQDVVRALTAAKVRGASFRPVSAGTSDGLKQR